MKKIIVLLFMSQLLFSQDFLPNKVTVGLPTRDYPPYIYSNDDLRGIALEPLLIICKKLGVKIEIKKAPSKRLEKLITNGDVDIVFRSYRWVEDPEMFLWSDEIISFEDILLTSKKNSFEFNTVKDLEGFILYTHKGYSYPTLESYFQNSKIIRYDLGSNIEMLEALLKSPLNSRRGTIINRAVAKWVVFNNKSYKNKFNFSEKSIDSTPYQLQLFINSNNSEFLKLFNTELEAMKKSGDFKLIIDSYLP